MLEGAERELLFLKFLILNSLQIYHAAVATIAQSLSK